MTNVAQFEFILFLIGFIIGLELIARWLRLPSAVALVLGGLATAVVPGIPAFEIDPDLVLVVFLPPLLLAGAYFSVWREFRANLAGILQLAVGGVLFTALAVGVVMHLLLPAIPWAACFALGAIVAPPDAVAAKAVLKSVWLPERITTLLEGESLLNDAASLVLYRFATAAALTGTFSLPHATLSFAELSIGGVVVGGAVGWVWMSMLGRIKDRVLGITFTLLMPWAVYIGADKLGVSSVIATVATGLVFGWRQHEILTADERLRGTAVWEVLIFLLESLVFVLIGAALREILKRHGGTGWMLRDVLVPVVGIVAAVLISRFVWLLLSEGLSVLFKPRASRPSIGHFFSFVSVMGWCGMRGVVSLAIVLALPENMPGRDIMQLATFAVILVSVLGQGTTLGLVIRLTGANRPDEVSATYLSVYGARALVAKVQKEEVERLAYGPDGVLIHARLLEQYTHRARVSERFFKEQEILKGDRQAHYRVLLSAIAAGRMELLRLHRSGVVHDGVLHQLEHELDLQQMATEGALH